MFSDFEAKTVSFYKKNKKAKEEEKSIQTDDLEIEIEEKIIQTQILKENATQTAISEIINILEKDLNLDTDKLKLFLDKVVNQINLVLPISRRCIRKY